jgi:hypothetical protein
MVGRITSVLIVVFLLLGALTPILCSKESAAQESGKIEAMVSTKGTFLLADPFEDDRPEGGSDVEYPAIVDLRANGILGNMLIMISFQGQICYDLSQDPPQYSNILQHELLGVFSTSNQLRPISELNRVPGAIDYGKDAVSGETWFDERATDIPQDFEITPDMEVFVPINAKYLFICTIDVYYPDNLGTIHVTIDKDTDGDSLYDSWEEEGIDFDKNGEVDLDLPMLGADWEHKDIFIEADYMRGNRPDPEALEDVKAAFANAQVSNPDNLKGINLHVLLNEDVPWKETTSFAEYYALKNTYFGTEDERLNVNAIQAKKMTHRYCLFANKLSINGVDPRCPGVAEGIVCDDFILAFGAFQYESRKDQAAVFMHELGHTLGLGHGGNVSVNYKPNYLSIMNYAFQFDRLAPTRPLDYSYGKCIDLDESKLDEFEGIGQAKATVWKGPNNTIYRDPNGMTIDWEYNGWIDNRSVKLNVNNHDGSSPPNEILTDFNDWTNLVYKFRGTPLSAASAFFDDYHIELTTDQIAQMEEEAANIIVVDSPTIEDSDAGLPIEAVLAIVAVAAVVMVVAVLFFMRKKKK